MKKFILIFSLIVSVNSYVLKAHQDLLLNQYYANIHYQVYFGYINEEINKVKLVSILCNKLSKELKFDDDINIYFEHEYIGFNKPHYTISTCSAGFESLDRCLNIFISEKKVDLEKILKLVEFGIKNYDYCADNQSLQEYQKVITYKRYSLDSNKRTYSIIPYNEYFKRKRYNISIQKIDSILTSKPSSIITKILNQKNQLPYDFCHPKKPDPPLYSIYFTNNIYLLCLNKDSIRNSKSHNDTILLELDNINQYSILDSGYCVIFNTDSSFYVCSVIPEISVSNIQFIKDFEYSEDISWLNYEPKDIEYLGNYIFSIYCGEGNKNNSNYYDLPNFQKRFIIYNLKENTISQKIEDQLIKMRRK